MHGKYFLNKCVALVKSLSQRLSFLPYKDKALSSSCWGGCCGLKWECVDSMWAKADQIQIQWLYSQQWSKYWILKFRDSLRRTVRWAASAPCPSGHLLHTGVISFLRVLHLPFLPPAFIQIKLRGNRGSRFNLLWVKFAFSPR